MKQSIIHRLSSVVSVALLLLLFIIVLLYFLVVDASYPADWKEARNFNLSVKSCGEAERKAKADFEREVVRMYFAGGFDEDMLSFPHTFYKQLEEKYNIEVILAGDVGSPHFQCYNFQMDSLLSKRIGERTIEKLYQKLHKEKYGKKPQL